MYFNIIQCPSVHWPMFTNPDDPDRATTLFVAGGISGCSDWQTEYQDALLTKLCAPGGAIPTDVVAINPRRLDFDTTDVAMSVAQIEWEYAHLERADIVSFWFTSETVCPITLFELGQSLKRRIALPDGGWKPQKVFVGVHPLYSRRLDVIQQVRLNSPSVEVVHSVDDLATQVTEWIQGQVVLF